MSLVTETGTGASDAESFASVADYKAYCDGRGIDWSTLTDLDIEADLRKGADYMEEAYRTRWAGLRVSMTQALSWPRFEVPMRDAPGNYGTCGYAYWPYDEVPAAVIRANIVLALKARESTTGLNPDLTQAVKREKVGQIETEYQDYSNASPAYPAIDGMLEPFFAAGGGVRLVRA